MTDTASIDVLLATLNATDVGSLDTIAQKMPQVQRDSSRSARRSWPGRRRRRWRRCGAET